MKKTLTEQEFIEHIRKMLSSANSQRDISARFEVSEDMLSNVLSGRRRPSESFAAAFGFARQNGYVRMK